MSRSMVLFDAAGLAAAFMAAPVHTPEQGKVTSVMPFSKNTEIALQSYWPNLQPNVGGTLFPLRALTLMVAIRGIQGTIHPIGRSVEIDQFTLLHVEKAQTLVQSGA